MLARNPVDCAAEPHRIDRLSRDHACMYLGGCRTPPRAASLRIVRTTTPEKVLDHRRGPGRAGRGAAARASRARRPRRRATAARRRAVLGHRGRRLPVRPRADVLPLPARARTRSSSWSAATCTAKCRWSGSTRSTASSSAAAGDLDCTPDVAAARSASREAQPRRRAERPPLPRRQPRQAREASARASNGRSSAGATCCAGNSSKLLPLLRPWLSLDARTRPLLQRPARPARVLVPVEVPGHVAVQLPEPVLDPVVPGIRVRRLAPARRLRGGLARRWPASPTSWA